MKKYALIINEQNKMCQIGLGANIDFYKSIGMKEMDVEQSHTGDWYLKGFAPQQSLEELKHAKRIEINQARDKEEQRGFEYLGKRFDSDSISCLRISCAAQSISLAPQGSTITWTCQDNSTIELDVEKLTGLVMALANHSNLCHQKASELKKLIASATTKEKLETITW